MTLTFHTCSTQLILAESRQVIKINVCIKKVHLTGVSSEPYLFVCVGKGVDISERGKETYGKGGR